jgi:ATP-dependent helicase/nuclease subunit A
MDRIAWLALLRAPWCALELRDLHTLCGVDEQRHTTKSVLQQISERLQQIDPEPRERVERLLTVMQSALQRRHTQISFASLIERTWHSLGGPACVDPSGYENALTYFRMLENIAPDGIAATGEAMEDSLKRLCAQPDPSVSERCGIQLMTIHKAKGLGFNIVLVPGLNRRTGHDALVLIRYLERTTGAGTELLVAPIGNTGEDASPTNKWVKRQHMDRDAEERKRLLYVACTRARQELHLFGTATVTQAGLKPDSETLLQAAWPAVEPLFTGNFAPPQQTPTANVLRFPSRATEETPAAGVVRKIAAQAGHFNLRRLPSAWTPAAAETNVTVPRANTTPAPGDSPMNRLGGHEAARPRRILGTVVHALFERAARLFQQGVSQEALFARLPSLQRLAAVIARNEGLPAAAAKASAKLAAKALESALTDSTGRWILKTHADYQIETSWTGVLEAVTKTLQIDRAFRAGAQPLSEGEDYLWIVDYKTATHSGMDLGDFLATQRGIYKDQLEGYGRMMRLAHGEDLKIRLGLYYPLLKQFDDWEF